MSAKGNSDASPAGRGTVRTGKYSHSSKSQQREALANQNPVPDAAWRMLNKRAGEWWAWRQGGPMPSWYGKGVTR